MLSHFFPSRLSLGLAQAAVVAAAALLVAAFAQRRLQQPFVAELLVALARGIGQILVVGSLLVLLLHGPQWLSWPVLAAMMAAAANIVRRRALRIPRAFTLALLCIFIGAGGVIALMSALGVVQLSVLMLIPVGSMVIANVMNMQALFYNRFAAEVTSHTGEIESALALGATSSTAVRPYLNASFRASLIPATDNLRSLGIVWIPGLMAGMVLSGSPPLYAALYQFVVLAMIFTAGSLSCLIASHLLPARIFSPQDQLLLRP
ncbi:MAG: ABC transporter permease [Acidobacteriaceae bacterium]